MGHAPSRLLRAAMAFACVEALRWSGFHARMPATQVLILGLVILLGVALYIMIVRLLGASEPAELIEALRSHRDAPAHPADPSES